MAETPTIPQKYQNLKTQLANLISKETTTKEDKSNKVTSILSSSTDTQYPSAKSVYDTINTTILNSIKVQTITGTISSVAAGGTGGITSTVQACPAGYGWFVSANTTGWGNVSNVSLNGTQLTVTMLNTSSSTHSIAATIKLIYYPLNTTFEPIYSDGSIVTAWGSTPSDENVPSEKLVRDSISPYVYDSGWVYGNGANGWMNSNWIDYDTNNQIRVRRIGKVVHFEGTAKPQNSLSNNDTTVTIGTLPEQFRPNRVQRFLMQGSGKNTWLFSVSPNGTLGFARYGTTSYATMPVDAWMNMYATWFVD